MNRVGLRALAFVFVAIVAFGGASLETPSRSALAYGNGDGTSNTHTVIGVPVPFSQSYSAIVQGDYVAGGVGMRASGPPGSGTINLPAAPGGSTIVKAFLEWSVINTVSTAALGQGTINGNAIAGTSVGVTQSPCWDLGGQRQIYTFVSDVTGLATFGANSLTGFPSGGPPLFTGPEPLLEGASLIVVYTNPASQYHQVDVYQGAITFDGLPRENLTMSGYNAVAGTSQTTWVVADGQPNSPPFSNKTYVDGVVTQNPALNGSNGNFWDTNTQSVTANIPPADTSIQVSAESGQDFGSSDCLTWVGQYLSTPAQTPATPTPTPSPTPSPTPTPTPSPTPSPTTSPTPTPTPVVTGTPTATAGITVTPVPTSTSAVGGFVDVVTAGSSGGSSSTPWLLAATVLLSLAGLAGGLAYSRKRA